MSAESKSRSAWGAGRTAFAALSPEIFGELAREIPMSVVHRKYRDRLGISYSQFTRHVRTFKARENFQAWAATAVRGLLLAAGLPNRLRNLIRRGLPKRSAQWDSISIPPISTAKSSSNSMQNGSSDQPRAGWGNPSSRFCSLSITALREAA